MSVIPVFVSSTFRDFHRERDELNRTVLPVLNELAAPFGSRVELIDLRWGITAEDGDARSRDLRILDVCLSEITRAEPLFVGLLGERYGWVAPLERMQRAAYEAGMSTVPADSSVTALEFEFGALRARSQTALFFEREVTGEVPEGWRDADLSKVAGLKERVHDLCTVHRYQVDITASSIDLSHFVATVAEHLGAQVRARARQLSATTVDPVSAATKLFFDDRSHGFAGRTALVEEVTDIADGGGSVCLSGASGSGKSAVWCAAVSRLRSRGHRVIAIPAAVAPEVATLHGILLRICGELGSTPDVSISPDELVQHAGELLGAAAPIIVAIDALDQLPDDTRLTFFTAPPSGVRILTSTTLDDHVNHLSGVGIQRVAVPSMDAEATRAAVTAISTSIRRTLPPEAVDSLASRERSPLWLRLAIAELLALDADDYAGVDPTADALQETARLINSAVTALPPAIEGLVDRVINRSTEQFGEYVVRSVLKLCAVSRSGLRPFDIEQLVGIDALTVAGIRRGLAPLLAPRREGGRLGFTHAIISAHIRRSIPNHEIERLHARLVTFLATYNDDRLCVEDRLWHAFRSPSQSTAVAQILNHPTKAEISKISAVIVDSVHAPHFRNSLRELSSHGVHDLITTAHRFKSELTGAVRAELAIALFDAARQVIDRGETSPTAFSVLSDASGCLADLSSVSGINLFPAVAEARRFTKQLLEERPDNIMLIEAFALTTMAFVNESPGRSDLIEELTQACNAWEVISQREPSIRTDSWHQFALLQLGTAYATSDCHEAARAAYLKALPMAHAVDSYADTTSPNSSTNSNLVNLYIHLGDVAGAVGRHDEARDYFRSAVDIAQDMYTRNPYISQTSSLAVSAFGYGKAFMNLHEYKTARQWLDYSDELFRRRVQLEPTTPQWIFGARMAAMAAGADVIDGDYNNARKRLRGYLIELDSTGHHGWVFAQTADELLDIARKNPQYGVQIAQLVIDTASLEESAKESNSANSSQLEEFEQTATQEVGDSSRDRSRRADADLALVFDARELIAEHRAGNGDPDWLDTVDAIIGFRIRRLEGSQPEDITDRARELGRALLLEASELRGHDRAQAAANIAHHWTTYLSDDDGDEAVNRMLARRLTYVAMNEPAQADTLFPYALRYASLLVNKFPEQESHRYNWLGVLDSWGAHQANTGYLEDATATWIRAARTAGSPTSSEALISIRQSITKNLRRVSLSRSLKRSLRKECAAWADLLERSE
ncbi:MAG: DUF4062 domain-containing protein [Thermomicrobiales bacterium]|nr:DUF4062 domain-containing protein [Thermomicrobiales bacterium]